MSVYPPGATLEVWVDGAWRPATVVRARLPRDSAHWPGLDPLRAVFLDLDGDGLFDVVVHDPTSDLLRVPGHAGGRHLRSVG